MLGEFDTHEQTSVGGALDSEMGRTGESAGDEVARHRTEIIIYALTIEFQACVVPGRPEFAAASNIRQHISTAALQPQLAQLRRIRGRQRDLKAAIGIKDGRRAAIGLLLAGV